MVTILIQLGPEGLANNRKGLTWRGRHDHMAYVLYFLDWFSQ